MTVTLDVVLFSYLDRPIFDVFTNGKAGQGSGVYPETGGGTISGVQLKLGFQKITWRYTDTGETIIAKNFPELKNVPAKSRYLAIYIYPDNTVELLTSQYYPGTSTRGEVEIEKMRIRNGK